jgi:hypothetical protein
MKKNICAAVDQTIVEALELFCERTINDVTYRRSKSEIVNEALKEYLLRKGIPL